MKEQKRIIIAGAGIIGAAIAYQLARVGASVTVVEKGEPGQGATANSFAWINASRGKKPHHYYLLNRLGIAAWSDLEKQLPDKLMVRWGGSLEWHHDADRAAAVLEATRRHQSWGYPVRPISVETFTELEPQLTPGEPAAALFGEIEGHVDPVHVTRVLLAEAEALGAQILTGCEVVGLDRPDNQLQAVRTSQGAIPADTLVIAAGTGSPALAALAGLNVPLQDSPGVLVHTAPQPELIQRIILSPHGHMKQKPDGRLVVGLSFKGTDGTDTSTEAGQQLLQSAAQSLPHLSDIPIEKLTLGWRVLPADELPIIGAPEAAPDIYLAAMHSGITLGPLVGRLAASEILDGVRVDLLAPYRLERFAGK
ncbi:MAG: FAD-binding oxidoreductase [Anaerolineales bacterium]|nr:FAD-binding oxidoreductase [Anaerolineales bacterium]